MSTPMNPPGTGRPAWNRTTSTTATPRSPWMSERWSWPGVRAALDGVRGPLNPTAVAAVSTNGGNERFREAGREADGPGHRQVRPVPVEPVVPAVRGTYRRRADVVDEIDGACGSDAVDRSGL